MAEELVKETQYQRKKRLAAEKAAREAASVNPANPFANANAAAEPEAINESYQGSEEEAAQPVATVGTVPSGGTQMFAVPDSVGDGDDWLSSMEDEDVKVVAQVGESAGYEPITDKCIFALNYKENNTVVIRPYPIMTAPKTSVSVFSSITTLINDPSGEGDPIFSEISPRVKHETDEIMKLMLAKLKSDPELRKQVVRTIDNKYILGQILSNKNNPETVGKFVLFRIPYTLSKIFDEQGIYDALEELIKPSSTKAIVINMTYDESRARRIEYNVSMQTYALGQDKLVMTADNAFVNVGSDMNAFNAWKAQFYAAFKDIKAMYDTLLTYDPSKFTPEAAQDVYNTFVTRYQELNATMATSAGTAAAAIAQGVAPQIQTANPFAASAPTAPAANPFVGNMGGAAPANPFGAAASPSNGGFGDM